MTNEMKLLMAFIEASGFDVTSAYIEPELLEVSEEMGIAILSGFSTNNLVTISGVYKRGGNGSYFREIRGGSYDYKVTKKGLKGIKCNKCGTYLGKDAPLDSCLCGNSNSLMRFI